MTCEDAGRGLGILSWQLVRLSRRPRRAMIPTIMTNWSWAWSELMSGSCLSTVVWTPMDSGWVHGLGAWAARVWTSQVSEPGEPPKAISPDSQIGVPLGFASWEQALTEIFGEKHTKKVRGMTRARRFRGSLGGTNEKQLQEVLNGPGQRELLPRCPKVRHSVSDSRDDRSPG
jgi:hypothetical protein